MMPPCTLRKIKHSQPPFKPSQQSISHSRDFVWCVTLKLGSGFDRCGGGGGSALVPTFEESLGTVIWNIHQYLVTHHRVSDDRWLLKILRRTFYSYICQRVCSIRCESACIRRDCNKSWERQGPRQTLFSQIWCVAGAVRYFQPVFSQYRIVTFDIYEHLNTGEFKQHQHPRITLPPFCLSSHWPTFGSRSSRRKWSGSHPHKNTNENQCWTLIGCLKLIWSLAASVLFHFYRGLFPVVDLSHCRGVLRQSVSSFFKPKMVSQTSLQNNNKATATGKKGLI